MSNVSETDFYQLMSIIKKYMLNKWQNNYSHLSWFIFGSNHSKESVWIIWLAQLDTTIIFYYPLEHCSVRLPC